MKLHCIFRALHTYTRKKHFVTALFSSVFVGGKSSVICLKSCENNSFYHVFSFFYWTDFAHICDFFVFYGGWNAKNTENELIFQHFRCQPVDQKMLI